MALLGTGAGLAGLVLFLLELGRDRLDLFHVRGSVVSGFLLMAVLTAATRVVHELGHGLAVMHAGRSVRAGVMLYYGLPVPFVDTTDIWMAPRRMRMLVSLAGPWTGVAFGGLCTLAAVLLPAGPVGAFLFAWGFVLLLNALLNLNPLLELDGYYLLVDLVEKPMLRARAIAFVRGPAVGEALAARTIHGGRALLHRLRVGSGHLVGGGPCAGSGRLGAAGLRPLRATGVGER